MLIVRAEGEESTEVRKGFTGKLYISYNAVIACIISLSSVFCLKDIESKEKT